MSYVQNNKNYKSTQENKYYRLVKTHLYPERQAPWGCSKEAVLPPTPPPQSRKCWLSSPDWVLLYLVYSVTYKLLHNLEGKVRHGNTGNSSCLFLRDPLEVILACQVKLSPFLRCCLVLVHPLADLCRLAEFLGSIHLSWAGINLPPCPRESEDDLGLPVLPRATIF